MKIAQIAIIHPKTRGAGFFRRRATRYARPRYNIGNNIKAIAPATTMYQLILIYLGSSPRNQNPYLETVSDSTTIITRAILTFNPYNCDVVLCSGSSSGIDSMFSICFLLRVEQQYTEPRKLTDNMNNTFVSVVVHAQLWHHDRWR